MKLQGNMRSFSTVILGYGKVKNIFQVEFCRPIKMHKIWRAIELRHNRLEQMSILRREVDMRKAREVFGKHGVSALMVAVNEVEIKTEAIPVHMYHGAYRNTTT